MTTTTALPACPTWCTLGANHDYDCTDRHGRASRHHTWTLPMKIGHGVNTVEFAVTAEETITRTGTITKTPQVTILADLGTIDLTAAEARSMASILEAAAEQLERIAR